MLSQIQLLMCNKTLKPKSYLTYGLILISAMFQHAFIFLKSRAFQQNCISEKSVNKGNKGVFCRIKYVHFTLHNDHENKSFQLPCASKRTIYSRDKKVGKQRMRRCDRNGMKWYKCFCVDDSRCRQEAIGRDLDMTTCC